MARFASADVGDRHADYKSRLVTLEYRQEIGLRAGSDKFFKCRIRRSCPRLSEQTFEDQIGLTRRMIRISRIMTRPDP